MTDRANMFFKAYIRFKNEAEEMGKNAKLARDVNDARAEAFFVEMQRNEADTASFFFNEYLKEGSSKK